MQYYHATSEDNFYSILKDGSINPGIDRITYLADTKQNAVKFLALRCIGQPIYVFEINGIDESKVEETFDHSYNFFQCKAFGYPESIDIGTQVTQVWRYD